MMTVAAERLEVIWIPEQFGVATMFHDVVDLKLVMDHPTLCAGIATFHEHAFPFTLPAVPVIPAPHITVRALLFLHACMGRTAPFGHEHPTARLTTELHATPCHTRSNTILARCVRSADLHHSRGSASGIYATHREPGP